MIFLLKHRNTITKSLSHLSIVDAKRKDSCYEIGKRSGARLKYKVNKSEEFVIGGYTPGSALDEAIRRLLRRR